MNKDIIIFPLLLLSIFLITACGSDNDKREEASTETPEEQLTEEEALNKWIHELHNNPTTQQQKDQNTIINYVIDEGLQVKKTDSGIFYQILEEGTGPEVDWGDKVGVHYTSSSLQGHQYDSSLDKSEAMQTYVGNGIHGWNEALQLLSEGGKGLFIIPSHLAYGEEGHSIVPPNEILIFEIELMKILE